MNELVNSCRFTGRLGKDPELQYLPSGTAFVGFSIAINQTKYNNGEYEDETLWVDLVAFGKVAERVDRLLAKGSYVQVDAQYGKRPYQTRDGQKRVAHDFMVRNFLLLSNGKRKENGNGQREESTEQEEYEFSDLMADGELPF